MSCQPLKAIRARFASLALSARGAGLVPLGHARRDPATVDDGDAVSLSPGADFAVVLPTRRATASPPGQPRADRAGMLNERSELLAETPSIPSAQIALIGGAVDPEPNRLVRSPAIDVILQHDGRLLRQSSSRSEVDLTDAPDSAPAPSPGRKRRCRHVDSCDVLTARAADL